MKNEKFCPNHPDKKAISKGLCSSCYNMSIYNSNPEFRERQKKNARKYYQNNKPRFYELNKASKLRNPEKYKEAARKYHLKKTYNLTIEELNSMIEKQNGKCAICGNPDFGKKGPSVDHSHSTGKIRGILCGRCNKAVGLFLDDTGVMNKAIDYINNSKD